MPTAQQVADWIVRYSWSDLGAPMDPLSLEKHIYYAQSFYLVLNNLPLFPDEILAWQLGPVVPEVWQRYQVYGANPIVPEDEPRPPTLPAKTTAYLRQIVEFFGRYTGLRLSEATHKEQPWAEARHGIDPHHASPIIIPQLTLKSYYRSLTNDGEDALSRHEMLGVVSEPKWGSFYIAGICARGMTAHPFYDASLAQKLGEPVPTKPNLSDEFYRAPRGRDFVEFNKGDDIEEKIRRTGSN